MAHQTLSPVLEDKRIRDQEEENKSKEGVYDLFITPGKYQPKSRIPKRTPPSKRKHNSPESALLQGDKRPRTPSGQVISKTVGELKNVIEERINHDQSDQSTVSLSANANQHDQTRSVNNHGKHELMPASMCEPISYEVFKDSLKMCEVDNTNQIDKIVQSAENMIKEGTSVVGDPSAYGNPAVMDIRTVVDMLDSLKVELKKGVSDVLTEDPSIATMQKQIHLLQFKEERMLDTMASMQSRIDELQEKGDVFETNNAKKMVILSGFEASSTKKEARLQIEDFVHSELGINVTIEDFYYIGTSLPRDIVLILASMKDRHLILSNKNKLKDIVNGRGKGYFFREFKTSKQLTLEKQCKEIQYGMDEEEPVNQKEIYIQKGHVCIGGLPQLQAVHPPDPTSILKKSMTELNLIMATPLIQGAKISVKKNEFYGYTMCSNSASQIQLTYDKIRLNHADARHIACVWSIPAKNKYERIDACDDGEEGIGPALIKCFRENNIQSRAVFIVRKCGEKLGDKRISTYMQCVKQTVELHPQNTVTSQTEKISVSQGNSTPGTYADAIKSPPNTIVNRGRRGNSYRGTYRGRWRGRGGRGGQGRGRDNRREDKYKDSNEDIQPRVYVPKNFSKQNIDEQD